MLSRRLVLFALSAVWLAAGCAVTPEPLLEESAVTTRVYLVRHAEKLAGTDPSLTEAGEARAAELVRVLEDVEFTHIHSSDYARTRQTASPIAAAKDLEIHLYDPSDLEGFAADLLLTTGTHLVVGHSNTTPQLVEILGGDGGQLINEATEYDRLYIVEIDSDGIVSSDLTRYGLRYKIEN